MKHIIILLIACTLFPLTMQSQVITIMDMHHDDDTLDVIYTKDMLQGKLWELEIPEGGKEGASLCIRFKEDSMQVTFILEGKKYELPCVYYLSDSYLMDFDDTEEGSDQAGKYLQTKCLDADADGTGKIGTQSFWIRKLTEDTLEIVDWQSQDDTTRFHAKPL